VRALLVLCEGITYFYCKPACSTQVGIFLLLFLLLCNKTREDKTNYRKAWVYSGLHGPEWDLLLTEL
jgi:hypothetical protein